MGQYYTIDLCGLPKEEQNEISKKIKLEEFDRYPVPGFKESEKFMVFWPNNDYENILKSSGLPANRVIKTEMFQD